MTKPTYQLPDGTQTIMTPHIARMNNLTYASSLYVDVHVITDIINDDNVIERKETSIPNVCIGKLPIMVRSKACILSQMPEITNGECRYDFGGYFIVNGSEKVVICQERMVENKPLVFLKKDSGIQSHIVQVNSRSYQPNGMMQVFNIKIKTDGDMTLKVPILQEVNVFIMFRALGIQSDHDIINMIVGDENDNDMIDTIRISLDTCVNEDGHKIQTIEEAYDYLINKLKVPKNYSETSIDKKIFQKIKLQVDQASENLGAERGPCPDAADAGYIERFSNKLAIAPTASISIIAGNSDSTSS